MKKLVLLSTLAVVGLAALPALAAPKTYQVTGPVVAVTSDMITVQKGRGTWEIALGSTAVPAGVKVGSKVTIHYTMTASSILSKDEPAISSMKSTKSMNSAAAAPASAPAPTMAPMPTH